MSKQLPGRLILSHKTTMRDALSSSRKVLAVCLLLPSNEASYGEFLENLADFRKSSEPLIGVSFEIKGAICYLLPATESLSYFPYHKESYVCIIVERPESEAGEGLAKLADEEGSIIIEDMKDREMKKHEEDVDDYEYEMDVEEDSDHYSDDSDNKISPEESDREGK